MKRTRGEESKGDSRGGSALDIGRGKLLSPRMLLRRKREEKLEWGGPEGDEEEEGSREIDGKK